MALEWKDKVDGVDDVLAEDINSLASAIKDNESKIIENKDNLIVDIFGLGDRYTRELKVYDKDGNPTTNSENVHSGIFRINREVAEVGIDQKKLLLQYIEKWSAGVVVYQTIVDPRCSYFRLIDDLSAEEYPSFENFNFEPWDGLDGEHITRSPLSANQGYILDQKKEDVDNKVAVVDENADNTKYPTTKAVKDYVDDEVALKEDVSNKVDVIDDSINFYPSNKAVKDYVEKNTTNALKGVVTGSPLVISDISPMPHEMIVTEDVGAVTITRRSKNFYPSNETLSFPTNNNYSLECNIPQPFVLSITINMESINNANQAFIEFTYDDGSIGYIAISTWSITAGVHRRVSSFQKGEKILKKIKFINWGKFVGTIDDIQIETGTTPTEYESYVEPVTYESNHLNGVTIPSLYPTTVLTVDAEGVTMTAEYNRDINKVIANLENAILSLGGNV